MNTQHQHHWQLRLEHFGFSHVRLDWVNGTIHFNPRVAVRSTAVAVILGGWPEQISGLLEMLNTQDFCHVVGPSALNQWLLEQGWPADKLHTSWSEQGLSIELESYQPIPRLTWKEAIHKGFSTLRNPIAPIRRLRSHLKCPV